MSPAEPRSDRRDCREKMLGNLTSQRYNVWLTFLLCSIRALSFGWSTMFIALETPRLQHWCSPPPGINQTSWRSYAIPTDRFGGLSQCTQYPLDAFFSYHGQFHYASRHTPRIECRNGRSFENFILGQSVTAAFDLACESAWIREFLPAADILGSVIGYLVLGRFADHHGRKKVALCGAVSCVLLCLLGAFSPSVWCFFLARLFLSVADAGLALSCLAFIMELVEPLNHLAAIIVCSILGSIVPSPFLGLFAWLLQDFRYLHLCVGTAYFSCVLLVLIIQESPLWLVANSTRKNLVEEEANEDFPNFIENDLHPGSNDIRVPVSEIGLTKNGHSQNGGEILGETEGMQRWRKLYLRSPWTVWIIIFAAAAFALHNDLLAIYQSQSSREEEARLNPSYRSSCLSSGYRLDSVLMWSLGLSVLAQLGACGASLLINHMLPRRPVSWLSLIIGGIFFIAGSCVPQYGNFIYLYLLIATLTRLLLLTALYTQLVSALETASAVNRCSTIGACLASASVSIGISLAFSSGRVPSLIRELLALGCVAAQGGLIWFTIETKQNVERSKNSRSKYFT